MGGFVYFGAIKVIKIIYGNPHGHTKRCQNCHSEFYDNVLGWRDYFAHETVCHNSTLRAFEELRLSQAIRDCQRQLDKQEKELSELKAMSEDEVIAKYNPLGVIE